MKLKYIRKEGELMPPFYFGLAYRDWMRIEEVYLWMPFNFLVQLYKWLRNKWYKVQHIESLLDKETRKIRSEIMQEAYNYNLKLSNELEKYRNVYYSVVNLLFRLNNLTNDEKDKLFKAEIEKIMLL